MVSCVYNTADGASNPYDIANAFARKYENNYNSQARTQETTDFLRDGVNRSADVQGVPEVP